MGGRRFQSAAARADGIRWHPDPIYKNQMPAALQGKLEWGAVLHHCIGRENWISFYGSYVLKCHLLRARAARRERADFSQSCQKPLKRSGASASVPLVSWDRHLVRPRRRLRPWPPGSHAPITVSDRRHVPARGDQVAQSPGPQARSGDCRNPTCASPSAPR